VTVRLTGAHVDHLVCLSLFTIAVMFLKIGLNARTYLNYYSNAPCVTWLAGGLQSSVRRRRQSRQSWLCSAASLRSCCVWFGTGSHFTTMTRTVGGFLCHFLTTRTKMSSSCSNRKAPNRRTVSPSSESMNACFQFAVECFRLARFDSATVILWLKSMVCYTYTSIIWLLCGVCVIWVSLY